VTGLLIYFTIAGFLYFKFVPPEVLPMDLVPK